MAGNRKNMEKHGKKHGNPNTMQQHHNVCINELTNCCCASWVLGWVGRWTGCCTCCCCNIAAVVLLYIPTLNSIMERSVFCQCTAPLKKIMPPLVLQASFLRPMTMERRCCEVFFPNYLRGHIVIRTYYIVCKNSDIYAFGGPS